MTDGGVWDAGYTKRGGISDAPDAYEHSRRGGVAWQPSTGWVELGVSADGCLRRVF